MFAHNFWYILKRKGKRSKQKYRRLSEVHNEANIIMPFPFSSEENTEIVRPKIKRNNYRNLGPDEHTFGAVIRRSIKTTLYKSFVTILQIVTL